MRKAVLDSFKDLVRASMAEPRWQLAGTTEVAERVRVSAGGRCDSASSEGYRNAEHDVRRHVE